jgi:hypothetical protein
VVGLNKLPAGVKKGRLKHRAIVARPDETIL